MFEPFQPMFRLNPTAVSRQSSRRQRQQQRQQRRSAAAASSGYPTSTVVLAVLFSITACLLIIATVILVVQNVSRRDVAGRTPVMPSSRRRRPRRPVVVGLRLRAIKVFRRVGDRKRRSERTVDLVGECNVEVTDCTSHKASTRQYNSIILCMFRLNRTDD